MDSNTPDIITARAITEEYRQWILEHEIADAVVSQVEDNIRITSDYAICEVNFYEFEMIVAELRITNRKNDETEFFLHFEMRELDYAKELFSDMLETLDELRNRKSIQVLLSCTSALTTGLMADKLNEAASLIQADYHFNAVPFPELYEKASDYDMILLAPQIAYEGKKIRSVLEDMPVIDIPAKLFATYDAAGILEVVRAEYNSRKKTEKKKAELKSAEVRHKDASILVMAILMHSAGKIHIICRYYQDGKVQREERVLRKRRNLLKDIGDILDTTTCRKDHFDAIGITMPGEIHDGSTLDYRVWVDPEIDVRGILEERYNVPVVLKNNTMAGILGFHARHSHYDSCALLSQGIAARFGGVGAIVNGKLIEGAHTIAGEIKYILRRFYGLTISETHKVNPEEMLSTVEFNARCVISLIDPEIILIRNEMLPNVEELRNELLKTVPERNLPKLRKITDSDALEYMLLGIMILCLKELDRKEA